MRKAIILTSIILIMAAVIMIAFANITAPDKPVVEKKETEEPVQEEALNWEVPAFSLTNQMGETVSLTDFKGKVWLANMVFTRCPDVCPPMTSKMSGVQQTLKEKGLDVEIVSFSVDPEYDQPKQLQEFIEKNGVDTSNWSFLTNEGDYEKMKSFLTSTFRSAVEKQETGSEDLPVLVSHSTNFFLVNKEGKIVDHYDNLDPETEEVIRAVEKLKNK
ncbi:SCO family protein [Mechercharimyces sp. CAU 1602]|uniref:SCO family protein n=1 Tax=Mechercharimyces sp. CAU 1602 TaxID=2973933 RepID=UPI002161F2AF|nr:SCO family protein [Mechercharimyces sp. CAU 1602]MCS1352766.1 SCO family protein [Mechercharimyces sp. CAU 1602]